MRRSLACSLVSLALGLVCFSTVLLAGQPPRLQVPPDQRIVVLKKGADPQKVLARHRLAADKLYSHVLRGFSGQVPAGLLKKLAADPDVAYVENDVAAYAVAQTIPTGVKRIYATLNSVANIDGSDERVDVDVAIIDTGIDLTHPDLNVVANTSFVRGASTGKDDNGHGTHVAGTVGALDNGTGVVGVAPGARLWAVKVLDRNGSGYFSDVIKGIDYVTANADKIAVANLSLGGVGKLNSLREAIQNCVAAGVVVVVAAGNDSQDVYGRDGVFDTSDDEIPAAYPEVAAVSALADSDGQPGGLGSKTSYGPDDTLATFSNTSRSVYAGNPVVSPGLAIDFAAPGVGIYSTYKNGGYATMSGTSMASPHAAGAAALYVAAHGRATDAAGVAAIRQALIDSAQAQSDWRSGSTADPDGNHEGLVDVASTGGSPNPPPVNNAPTVAISLPIPNATFEPGATIAFEGTAIDTEDGDLTTSIEWTSSIDGPIGTGGAFTTTLSDGKHTITASVTDSGGKTAKDTVVITIASTPSLGVLVTTDRTSYKNRQTAYIRVAVTDLTAGLRVRGAAVHLAVTTPNGTVLTADGTTASNGIATFAYRVSTSRDGTGTATAAATASKAGYESGSGTTTFDLTK